MKTITVQDLHLENLVFPAVANEHAIWNGWQRKPDMKSLLPGAMCNQQENNSTADSIFNEIGMKQHNFLAT